MQEYCKFEAKNDGCRTILPNASDNTHGNHVFHIGIDISVPSIKGREKIGE